MKHYFLKIIFLIHLICAGTLPALETEIKLTSLEKRYIQEHPIIKAHNEENWPPFNFFENGEAKGYSIDYMNLIAKKVGMKVTYISGYSWSEYINMLHTPKLDLIINISRNKKRERYISFTDSFLSVRNAIYVNIHNQNINSIEDLDGKTIAMPKDFFVQMYIDKNHPKIKQVLVKDQLEALKLLSLGKVDATIGKKVVLDYIIQNNLISNILATQYIENDNFVSDLRIGASKPNTILTNIIKKAQKMVTQKEKEALNFKWFGAKMRENINTKVNLTQSEKLYLKKKKRLLMCVDPDWMPFEKIEEKKYIGFASDFIGKVSKKIHTNIVLVPTINWKESLKKIKNKECDILPMAGKTLERLDYLDFTSAYLISQFVIATKTNQIYINDLNNYIDKKFIVLKGDFFSDILRKHYPNIHLIETNSLHLALQKVEKNEVFGYLGDATPIMHEIQKNYLGTISIVGRSSQKILYRVASRNDEKILNTILEKAVNSISTREVQNIKNKWSNLRQDILIDYSLVWKITIGSIITILILMIFLRKQNLLKKEIENLNSNLQEKIKEEVEQSRKKDQTIFKQSKLVNMGEMIGNISHQWRQPLSEINSVLMNIESDFMKKSTTQLSLDKNLTKIEDLTEYMSNTIDSFNNFFKIDKETKDFMITDCILKVMNLFENSFAINKIDLKLQSEEDIKITNFEGEFLQVLIIILQNAKDALLLNKIKNAKIQISVNYDGNNVIIHIQDNAGGIPNKIIDKIFEPYFTTKFKSQGIGIGLYMAKVIVEKNMKGTLEVSNISNGANFCIKVKNIS